jgi:hypothetical protein
VLPSTVNTGWGNPGKKTFSDARNKFFTTKRIFIAFYEKIGR